MKITVFNSWNGSNQIVMYSGLQIFHENPWNHKCWDICRYKTFDSFFWSPCTPYIVQGKLHKIFLIQEKLYNISCSGNKAQHILFRNRCTTYLFRKHCEQYLVQQTMYNISCSVNIAHHILFRKHFTPYLVQEKLHNTSC